MAKKLVQINVVCNGSTGRIMTQIQKKAIENGWEAYSFFGRGNPANENCYKITGKFEFFLSLLSTRILDRNACGCWLATRKLIKKIKEINPDVIQLHNLHGYYLNIYMLFKYLKKCNKKIIWTLHDCWSFTGHCAHFTMAKCDKWKTKCEKCPQKRTYPESKFLDNSKNTFKKKKRILTSVKDLTIITPSEWLAKLVKQSFLGNYNVKVINNGIDLEVFKPTNTINIRQKYNIPENKNIILGVSAVWNEAKGLEDFIEISKKIDENSQIVLVGLENSQIEQLPQNIIGIPRTENIEELANLYTIAKVFVNPTHEDNFPTTNLEALACGTPVVTYNAGGSGECIKENIGKKIEIGNIELLLEAIYNTDKKSQLCNECAQKYDANSVYDKYMDLYIGKE